MSEIYEYREPTHFTAGAVGEPGNRIFYLQAGDSFGYHSVKLEKQQVIALSNFLLTVLDDLPAPEAALPTPVELIDPAQPVFVVGQIAVGVDEVSSRVVLVVEELVDQPTLEDELAAFTEEDDDLPGATLRVHVSVEQAAAFIRTAEILMEGGRPPCRLCGQPLDPSGHSCPRLN
ncbi:MAG: DUF3090 family protein [Acidimicrobiales bacterium]|nr:DUF3090 family protein [Acidimicrobiales bacterium]